MKTVYYVSCVCSELKYEQLFGNIEQKPGQQVQKYHRVFSKGFALAGANVKLVSLLPVNRMNCCEKVLERQVECSEGKTFQNEKWKVKYAYVKTYTSPMKRKIEGVGAVYKEIVRDFKRHHRREKDAFIICDVLNQTAAIGAILAAKK